MRLFRLLFPAALLAVAPLAAPLAVAQALPPSSAFTSIVHQPATETSFTLDRSMLALTDGYFNGQDPEGKRIAAGLNSITIHTYHYRDGANYDPGAFAVLDQDFHTSGYQHLVNANGRNSPTSTDLWLRFQGANVNSVVVLTRGDRNMSAIVVDCTLRPLDLLHLSGHFGIPQVAPGAIVPPSQPGAMMVPASPQGAVMVPAGPPPAYAPQPTPQSYPPPQAQAYPPQQATQPMPAPTLQHHSANDPQ